MASAQITKSSSAEYFAKNLQQVGFSSFTKAVLTSIKEAVDNALDACEEAGILPEISVVVEKIGVGTSKGADLIRVRVKDNGPGIPPDDIPKVFGEYLASSKFGRGRCSRGQQGIGISAVTTWAQLTHGKGVVVISKTKNMRSGMRCVVEVDIKKNCGLLRSKEMVDTDFATGVICEFVMDGRVQLNGEGGLITYLQGTALVNPHLTLHHKLLDAEEITIERVSSSVPEIPEATEPHPHTMKLGEFMAHGYLYGKTPVRNWFKNGFSRLGEQVASEIITAAKLPKSLLDKPVSSISEADYRTLYTTIQNTKLMAPSTKSVLAIGESDLTKSILRLGETDFFAVVSRKPTICDFKPLLVEVAIARRKNPHEEPDAAVQVLRFANRVPLQFDKSSCAIVKAIESVNWKSYGLQQPKNSIPQGPYILAVSVVSPFLKFKNASKETIDASDELVDELRLALIQCGQRLSAHLRRESKLADMERKLQHIEQFAPILVKGLVRILSAKPERETRAMAGLKKILGRDSEAAEAELQEAHVKADEARQKIEATLGDSIDDAREEHSKKIRQRKKDKNPDEENVDADAQPDLKFN